MKNPRRKIFFSLMGFSFVLATGYLFIYIEERKFEAHYYKNELEKLQQQNGVTQLLQQAATAAEEGSPLATLRQSATIKSFTAAESSELLKRLKDAVSAEQRTTLATEHRLTQQEIDAITTLLQTTTATKR